MKILILGNSHVGALIKAYKDEPCGDIAFLTVSGNSLLQNLEINDKCELISTRPHIIEAIANQGLQGVSLNVFDHILVYGCQLRAAGSGEHWVRKITSPTQGFSAQVLEAAHRDFVQDTEHFRFLERIRHWPLQAHVNVVSMPSPVPNELAPFWNENVSVSSESVRDIQCFIKQEINTLGFDYLDTPDSLLSDDLATTSSRFKGSFIHDTAHLNTAGGHEVLRAIRTYANATSDKKARVA